MSHSEHTKSSDGTGTDKADSGGKTESDCIQTFSHNDRNLFGANAISLNHCCGASKGSGIEQWRGSEPNHRNLQSSNIRLGHDPSTYSIDTISALRHKGRAQPF